MKERRKEGAGVLARPQAHVLSEEGETGRQVPQAPVAAKSLQAANPCRYSDSAWTGQARGMSDARGVGSSPGATRRLWD